MAVAARRVVNVTASARRRLAGCAAALCAILLLLPNVAGAAEWSIDPVSIDLSPQQQSAVILLKNESEQPTSLQIHAVSWSQVDGKDVYVPTREVLVSPPIATIPAKGKQILRVALRREADPTSELTYRINLQELPLPPVAGFQGVQVALRIGLPIFVQPQNGTAKAKITWSLARAADGKLKVEVSNQGNAHVQISDFAIFVPGREPAIAGDAGSTYVLPGQSHAWLLSTRALETFSGATLRLRANTDADNVDMELPLGRP